MIILILNQKKNKVKICVSFGLINIKHHLHNKMNHLNISLATFVLLAILVVVSFAQQGMFAHGILNTFRVPTCVNLIAYFNKQNSQIDK